MTASSPPPCPGEPAPRDAERDCRASDPPCRARTSFGGRRSPVAFSTLGALTLLLAGCVSLRNEYPEKRFFVLEAERNGTPAPASRPAILAVRKCSVAPRYEARGLVYRTGELTYVSDFYNQFFLPPDDMITGEIRRWLERSGLFRHVVDPSSQVEPTHALEAAVAALYGDFLDKRSPRAVLEVKFALIDLARAPAEIVFERDYRREVALETTAAAGLAAGLSDALGQVLAEFEKDLSGASW